MEVGVSLQPDGMDSFRKCFADAIPSMELSAGERARVNSDIST
uniref:Uncharacterized protein n=1 Tax=Arundo donax TaxID=35708 RepID=A0A0A9AW27_ARUDO